MKKSNPQMLQPACRGSSDYFCTALCVTHVLRHRTAGTDQRCKNLPNRISRLFLPTCCLFTCRGTLGPRTPAQHVHVEHTESSEMLSSSVRRTAHKIISLRGSFLLIFSVVQKLLIVCKFLSFQKPGTKAIFLQLHPCSVGVRTWHRGSETWSLAVVILQTVVSSSFTEKIHCTGATYKCGGAGRVTVLRKTIPALLRK